MRKLFKITLIVALSLMVVGTAISVAALAFAGFDIDKFSVTENEYTERIADIDGKDVTTLVIPENQYEFSDYYNIVLIPSEDKDFHFSYAAREGKDLSFDVQNHKLTVTSPGLKWSDCVGIELFGEYPSLTLTVAVPDTVETVDIRSDSVSVSCSDLQLAGDFVCYNDCAQITVENCSVKGMIRMEGDCSDVSLCDSSAVAVILEVDCGLVSLDTVTADSFDLAADSGDFSLNEISVGRSLKICGDCGSVSGTLNERAEDFTIRCEVEDGSSNLPEVFGNGTKSLDIEVDCGDVDIDFLKSTLNVL